MTDFKEYFKSIIEIDPNKKYILVFNEDLIERDVLKLIEKIDGFFLPGQAFYISGNVLQEIGIEDKSSS